MFKFFRCPGGARCWAVVMETWLFLRAQGWLKTKVKGRKKNPRVLGAQEGEIFLSTTKFANVRTSSESSKVCGLEVHWGWKLMLCLTQEMVGSTVLPLWVTQIPVPPPAPTSHPPTLLRCCCLRVYLEKKWYMLDGGYFSHLFCCSGNRSMPVQVLMAVCTYGSAAFTVIRKSTKANLQVLLSVMSKANCIISMTLCTAFKFRGPGYVH